MRADDEFGENATPKMYSYFEEALKRPNVKLWLEWNDDKEQFVNEERLKEFYGWMVPSDEEDASPKLAEAKSVRDLGIIVEDEQALNVPKFRD